MALYLEWNFRMAKDLFNKNSEKKTKLKIHPIMHFTNYVI